MSSCEMKICTGCQRHMLCKDGLCLSCRIAAMKQQTVDDLLEQLSVAEAWLASHRDHPRLDEAAERYQRLVEQYQDITGVLYNHIK